MIVSTASYLTIILFEPHSIYSSRLAKEGKLITHHTDHAVLTLMQLDSVIDRDYMAVAPDTDLGQIVHRISRSHHSVIPVTDAAGGLLGEIDIKKIRKIVFRIELYHHFTATQLMQAPPAMLADSLPMAEVMKTFDATRAEWLPVLDREGHLRGYVSRERLLTQYRKMVADMSED
jgi:CIC family chloride channel protein